jgi:uncharacterized integral membrane protein (TIGR00698 family)
MSTASMPAVNPVTKLPGLMLCVAVAVLAYGLGIYVPLVGGPVFGILLGLIISSFWRPTATYKPGMQVAGKQVLQLAIILMGFGLSLSQVVQTGTESLAVMLSTLIVCLVGALLLGRLLGVSFNLTALIGAGTGICGASAIAAVSPAIEADESEVAYALSTVFAFNIVAVVLFPAMGHFMGFSQKAFGLWAGTAINDTSSVVAAAYTYGKQAGEYATVVKLARSTMILPVVLGLSTWRAMRVKGAKQVAWTRLIPWFILWFLAATLVRSLGLVPSFLLAYLPWVAKFLIIIALSAVGLNANLDAIVRTGWRPLAMGATLWVLVAITSVVVQHMVGQL